jgi:hypothetical protein
VIQEIEDNGLRLTGTGGFERRIAPDSLTLAENPQEVP